MTSAELKEQLPDVKIFYGGRLFDAALKGRKERFASVIPYMRINGGRIWGESRSFTWETVLRSVNDNVPLNAPLIGKQR